MVMGEPVLRGSVKRTRKKGRREKIKEIRSFGIWFLFFSLKLFLPILEREKG